MFSVALVLLYFPLDRQKQNMLVLHPLISYAHTLLLIINFYERHSFI